MDRHYLWHFFEPKGVAIVGARSTPGFGFQLPIWMKKHGHEDKIFMVNPRGGTLHGLPVYESLSKIPPKVDLAVIITPAPAVPRVLLELAGAGIKNVIIESAGFAETDESGKALQEKCKAIASDKGLRVMGPNCVGVVNTENKFATSEAIEAVLKPGRIGVVAQSGVFGSILLDCFPSKGLAISRGVTLGNRLGVNECDVLDFFCDDPMTKVVLMYIEGAADGVKLRASLERITPKKPVIVLKSGRTAEGKAAAASHTGSMSGSDEIYDGLFAQTGAIRVSGVGEMIDFAGVFDRQPLPKGNRICVVTTSGSMGAVSIDAAVKGGLVAASLSDKTVNRVREGSPSWMNVRNPLDVGPSGMFRKAFESALDDAGVDMLLLFCTIPYAVIEGFGAFGINARMWLGPIGEIRRQAPEKPVLAAITGHPDWAQQMREISGDGVSLVEYPENAARALVELERYARFKKERE